MALPVPEVGLTVSQLGMPVIVQEQFDVTDRVVFPADESKSKLVGLAIKADAAPSWNICMV